MKNNNKTEEFKEKLKQALTSTARVISDDLDLKDDSNQNKSSQKFDFFNLENLNTKSIFAQNEKMLKGMFKQKVNLFEGENLLDEDNIREEVE